MSVGLRGAPGGVLRPWARGPVFLGLPDRLDARSPLPGTAQSSCGWRCSPSPEEQLRAFSLGPQLVLTVQESHCVSPESLGAWEAKGRSECPAVELTRAPSLQQDPAQSWPLGKPPLPVSAQIAAQLPPLPPASHSPCWLRSASCRPLCPPSSLLPALRPALSLLGTVLPQPGSLLSQPPLPLLLSLSLASLGTHDQYYTCCWKTCPSGCSL